MQLPTPFRTALFALLCLCAQPLFAAIGTIDSFEGDVRVASKTGDLAAHAGMEINEGDTIKTGANAWALLAMTDGASMTLRPQSQLRLDTYRYVPDGEAAKNTTALSLLKGALRSVTGYIGRINRDGYRITTPTATIGIRGTDHEPAYYPPAGPGEKPEHEPGTYDKVNEGETVIRNPKGEVPVRPGQYAFVHHDGRVAPRLLARAPAFYQRHAAFDQKAAVRRQEFHRQFEEQRQLHRQESQSKPEPRKQALEQTGELQQRRHEMIEKREAMQEQKKQERAEELKKRTQERQELQARKKQERAEELTKRHQEHAQKNDGKKDHEEEKKERWRHR